MSDIDCYNYSLLLGGLLLDKTHLDGLSSVSLLLLIGSLDSSSLSLLSELLLSDLLLLDFMDGLDKNRLVLELVTLRSEIELMVDVLGNLLSLSVLLEESSENSLSSHPEYLGWHSGVLGSLSFSVSSMSSLSLGHMELFASRYGVLWIALFMMRPPLKSFLMLFLELARSTSYISLGSIQTLLFPHFNTVAASLYCSLKNAINLYFFIFAKQ